ncbi:uroporphyrinogen-III synthase [Wenzhouxiangella sp. AB-CW3]|uniref:uroporphyrinogen-III synthase n=1 Tax=Wenzhouxiangella sp. AB-CW3 TaxID=2771012 RepID=UPI00168AA79F|nr:uroporphyrinogen-III synthase [Wenzhouxiangella sp. AB-CW3]QOC23652.1 uroporphyrinogen-III synthase [Wenzhouxiangella sp. AB-CW3]
MSVNPLVLVTRTEQAGKALAEKVESQGLSALHCAPFALKAPEQPDEVAAQLDALLPADLVIITSQEGVRRSAELVGAERFARALVVVPGEGTAQLARELGFANVIYPSRHGTSEAMLALPELREVDGLSILILAAEGGRGLMGRTLEERGAVVDRIHVYRRVRQAMPEDLGGRIDEADLVVTLAASWEAVSGLCEALDDELRRQIQSGVLVAPSQRVADRSAAIGFERCRVAGGADDHAMLSELHRLTRRSELR